MNSPKRKESWRRHDTKRKSTELRKQREEARAYVRHKMKVPKSGTCALCDVRAPTVLHHASYEPVFLVELCAKCHRAAHPRKMPNGGVR